MSGDIFPSCRESKTKVLFAYLKLKQIDPRDDTFRFTDQQDYSCLKQSVSRVGILHPLLIQKKASIYRIVRGFKRFQVAKTLGLSRVPVRVLDEEISPEFTFRIALLSRTRKYRLPEKARALLILKRLGIPSHRILHHYLPYFDIPVSEYYLNSYLEILSFSSRTLNYLSGHPLSLKQAQMFRDLSPQEQDLLIDMAEEFKLRGLELQDIVTDLREISRRDSQSVGEILQVMNLEQSSRPAKSPQKIRLSRLKKVVKEKRYPELTKNNQELKIIKKGLRINCPHSLSWDDSLERPGLRLLLDITTPEQVKYLIRDLSRAENICLLRKLLERL